MTRLLALTVGVIGMVTIAIFMLWNGRASPERVSPSSPREQSSPEAPDLPRLDSAIPAATPGANPPANGDASTARGDPLPPAAAPSLRVVSELGIRLSHVELDFGEWAHRALDANGTIDLLEWPRRVRAPGHLPCEVTAGAKEVVLEPDLAFELRCAEEGCFEEIEIDWPTSTAAGFDDVLSRGETASGDWALAVHIERFKGRFPWGYLGINVVLSDFQWLRFRVDVASGVRARYDLPALEELEMAPVSVELGGARTGDLRLRLVSTGKTSLVREEPQEWGTVQWYGRVIDVETTAAGEAKLTMPSVPLDEEYLLSAVDPDTGAFGRAIFRHDGSPVRLQLAGGLVVGGRFVAPAEDRLPARVSFTSEFHDSGARHAGSRVWGWRHESLDQELSEDGRFRLVLPQKVPGAASIPAALPPLLELEMEVPGFAPLTREVLTAGRSEADLGDIPLRSVAGDLVLAPGHGLAPEDLRFTWIRTSEGGFDIWDAHERPDGSLHVYLAEDPFADFDPKPEGVPEPEPWKDAPAIVLGLRPDGSRGAPFVLDGPRYRAVETETYPTRVSLGGQRGEHEMMWVGWSWRGIEHAAWYHLERGRTTEVSIEAPAEGAQLWWSSEAPRGGEGERVPLPAGEVVID